MLLYTNTLHSIYSLTLVFCNRAIHKVLRLHHLRHFHIILSLHHFICRQRNSTIFHGSFSHIYWKKG